MLELFLIIGIGSWVGVALILIYAGFNTIKQHSKRVKEYDLTNVTFMAQYRDTPWGQLKEKRNRNR